MFISKPLSDDHLPASADGNIEDVHVSAFQTAIDGLLSAARYVISFRLAFLLMKDRLLHLVSYQR
jgi:hypothetical protein